MVLSVIRQREGTAKGRSLIAHAAKVVTRTAHAIKNGRAGTKPSGANGKQGKRAQEKGPVEAHTNIPRPLYASYGRNAQLSRVTPAQKSGQDTHAPGSVRNGRKDPATEEDLLVVQGEDLPTRKRALRLVKKDLCLIVADGFKSHRRRWRTISGPRQQLTHLCYRFVGETQTT
ncbi:MAG: hypothetical protein ACI9TH_004102, partial [Kiritimatiellia bacterium]